MRNPTLVTTVNATGPFSWNPPELVESGVDGLRKTVLLRGAVSEPAWSSRGELAVVRGGWIWVGRPGKLRRLTRGSAPAWSSDGGLMVFVRGGWLMVGRVSDRSFRRLVRGTASAWSPNGKWIAFIGKRHRLSVVPASGGRVRRVGGVTGTTVDWQPLPARPSAGCLTPPGSTVLASSSTAILSGDSPGNAQLYPVAMGCLRADGRERLLDPAAAPFTFLPVVQAALAGPYAALLFDANGKAPYCPAFIAVKLYDLRTAGALAGREISTSCAAQASGDQLVLGSDAVMAAHVTLQHTGTDPGLGGSGDTVEQMQASDSTGVHTLDSITEPDGSPPALTNLTLSGDTLTWQHNGSPRSAQLQP